MEKKITSLEKYLEIKSLVEKYEKDNEVDIELSKIKTLCSSEEGIAMGYIYTPSVFTSLDFKSIEFYPTGSCLSYKTILPCYYRGSLLLMAHGGEEISIAQNVEKGKSGNIHETTICHTIEDVKQLISKYSHKL